ncbi:MAG: hypothetical protein WBL61_08465 [Bryobacteraceae bacterium]
MRALPAVAGVGLVCLMSLPAAVAQQGAGAIWDDLRAKNPPGIELSLRLIDPHAYRENELIRAEMKLPAEGREPTAHPPREMWQFAGFLLDPPANCGSLDAPCVYWMPQGRFGRVSSGFVNPASPRPIALNDYFHRLRPGRYRAAVLVRKLVASKIVSTTYGYTDPPEYAVSNTVEFAVVAATEEWGNRAIAASVATLSAPNGSTSERYAQRRAAAEQLRILDVPAAWRASLTLLNAEEGTLLEGLEATGQPARVCRLMQAAVPAPAQMVSSNYLRSLAQICARANLPPPPPYKPPEPSQEQLQYWNRYHEYEQRVTGEAAASLAASLARKLGDAKAVALQALLERTGEIRQNEPGQAIPAWVRAVREEFVKSLPAFDAPRRRQLLSLYASTLRTPDAIPPIEAVLDGWKPGDYYEAPHEALHSLYDIDPARAQARIVTELGKERTWLDAPQLELLPAGTARITDEMLFESLEADRRGGGWNIPLRMMALAKYASPEALPRIRAIYESQPDPCQPELMAYFVRVDPDYADRVFHSHPWDIHVEPPKCTLQYFERTPQLAMGPPLEQYMAAYLMQGQVPLKRAAARSLGRFGSSAAAGPLWDAFRYFHDWWKGKPEELEQNRDGVLLEVDLRNAIARGTHWVATDADLRTIESLCISEQCVNETREDLLSWRKPLKIEVYGGLGGMKGFVAQYRDIAPIDALEEKLGEFPKETPFLLSAVGDRDGSVAAHIRAYAAAHGLTLVSH